MKKLGDDRLETFNTDFVRNHVGWDRIDAMIRRHFPEGDFSFLDVGGGNGVFTDRLLSAFPAARGTVLDNAAYLLGKNQYHERKTLVETSVEDMRHRFGGTRFDLVVFNWVLHHLVEDTYRGSLESIAGALASGRDLLSERGVISVLENCYEPRWGEALPSKIIYHALSSKVLSRLTRLLGANTSGTGVCYLSEVLWRSMLEDAGLEVLSCVRTGSLETSALRRILCVITGVHVVHITAGRLL